MPSVFYFFFFFQAEDGIRDVAVTGVQTCALPICVINRALEKDRELRYQHAADMKSELLGLKRDTETGRVGVASSASVTVAEAPVAGRRKVRKFVLPITSLIVAALTVGGRNDRSRPGNQLTGNNAI